MIPILGHLGKALKDIGIPTFTAARFTAARTWKQPRCPLTGEWIKKMWSTHTMEYHSAIKRNETHTEGSKSEREEQISCN